GGAGGAGRRSRHGGTASNHGSTPRSSRRASDPFPPLVRRPSRTRERIVVKSGFISGSIGGLARASPSISARSRSASSAPIHPAIVATTAARNPAGEPRPSRDAAYAGMSWTAFHAQPAGTP